MEFKSRHNITEKRQELRETLRHKFAQLCCKGNKIEHLAKE